MTPLKVYREYTVEGYTVPGGYYRVVLTDVRTGEKTTAEGPTMKETWRAVERGGFVVPSNRTR